MQKLPGGFFDALMGDSRQQQISKDRQQMLMQNLVVFDLRTLLDLAFQLALPLLRSRAKSCGSLWFWRFGAPLGRCRALFFPAFAVSLGIDIFTIKRTDSTYESFYLEIQHNGNTITIEDPITSGKNTKYYYFPHTLVAKEMADQLTLRIYGVKADGTVCVSEPVTWSIKQGAIAKMDSWYGGTEKEMDQCILLANMLNYGAEAQKHFGYNTENLATDGLDEKYLALIKTEIPEMSSIPTVDDTGMSVTLSSIELNLAEKVQILVKYKMPDKNFVKEDYHAEIKRTHTNDDGTTTVEIHTVNGEDCIQSGRYLYVFFNELASNYMRDALEITLYKGDEVVAAVQSFSAESVFSNKLSINPSLVYAMMNYGDCAKKVFGSCDADPLYRRCLTGGKGV